MEGKVAGKKEITLDTDWLTALLAAGGLVVIIVLIGSDLWRVLHGQFTSRPILRESAFWRLFDSFFNAFGIFICMNFVAKSEERVLRFAFGLMSIAMLSNFVILWIHLSVSALQTVTAIRILTELPAFVLLAVCGVNWFKGKVFHV